METKTIKLQHGIPSHNDFGVIIPHQDFHSNMFNDRPYFFEFTDPKSGKVFKAIPTKAVKYDYNDIPGILTHLIYGKSPEDMAEILLMKYPELREKKSVTVFSVRRAK